MKTIILEDGTKLYADPDQVWFEPCTEQEAKAFTLAQQRVVIRLADNLNRFVSYEDLYQAYKGERYDGVNRNLHRMKDNMPTAIKKAIRSKNGKGYQLCGTPLTSQAQVPPSEDTLDFLTGTYYGLYPDPAQSGSVLGICFRVVQNGSTCSVYGIVGLRNDEVLFHPTVDRIFADDATAPQALFEDFKNGCSPNDQRCLWCEGEVTLSKPAAEITLVTTKGSKWYIQLDLGSFLDGHRHRYPSERGKYRGGMGIVIASSSQYKTFAGKIGIIRKGFCLNRSLLKDPKVEEMLVPTPKDNPSVLMVAPNEDNHWYNWIMTEDPSVC